MITFHIERFSDVYDEMYPLLVEHYEEISQHREHGVPLEPQRDIYAAREAAGNLLMVIARDAGRIVGYFVAMIAPALHYASCLTCSPDIFYVQMAYRRDGTAAAMFGFVEKELKRRGVKVWMVGSKHAHNVTQLFEHLSFEPFEITYVKWLEETPEQREKRAHLRLLLREED